MKPNKKSLQKIYCLIAKQKFKTVKQLLKIDVVCKFSVESFENKSLMNKSGLLGWERKPQKSCLTLSPKTFRNFLILCQLLTRLSQENERMSFYLFSDEAKSSQQMKKCDSEPGGKKYLFPYQLQIKLRIDTRRTKNLTPNDC